MRTPKLCHHKASQQGYVTLDRREHYLGRWPRGQKNPPDAVQSAYDLLIARWLSNGRKLPAEAVATGGSPPPVEVVTVNAIILQFVPHSEAHYAKNESGRSGEIDSIKDVCKLLTQMFGRLPAAEFGPKALRAVRVKMLELDWSRGYVNHQAARIRRMFRWAAGEELVSAEVWHRLQTVSPIRRGESGVRETEPVLPVPDADLEAAVPCMPPAVAAMVRLQVLSGMRPGEVVMLCGRHIDRTGKVWVFRPQKHKNAHRGHAREVYLGPKAQAVLTPWLKADPDAFLFSPAEAAALRREERSRGRKTPRFPSHMARNAAKRKAEPERAPGERYTTHSYTQAVRRACEKADQTLKGQGVEAGCPTWVPRQLRHNAASAIANEFGIEMARLVCGHKHGFTTEIYTRRDRASVLAVMEKAG